MQIRSPKSGLVLCFHTVLEHSTSRWVVRPEQFERQLNIVAELGFEFSSYESLLLESAAGGALKCAITFDDGRSIAPQALSLLDIRQVPAMFFLCVGFLTGAAVPEAEGYSTFQNGDDVTELLGRGHHIGSHGLSHCQLPACDGTALDHELRESRRMLQEMFGGEVQHFSAPFGAITPGVVSAARDAGYRSVAATIPGLYPSALDPMIVPRLVVRGDLDDAVLRKQLQELLLSREQTTIVLLRDVPQETFQIQRLASADIVLYPSNLKAPAVLGFRSVWIPVDFLIAGKEYDSRERLALQGQALQLLEERRGVSDDADVVIEWR